jgi:uncharacterized protein (DUF1800 family)
MFKTDPKNTRDPVSRKYENKELPTHSRLQTGLEEYNGPWSEAHHIHFFKRTLFGVSPQDLQWASDKSMEQVVNQVLQDRPLPDPPLNHYHEVVEDPFCGLGETWVNAPQNDPNPIRVQREISLRAWIMSQQIKPEISLTEQMVFFWHNHLPIETQVISDPRIVYKYINLLRTFALGNFKELVYQITIDPGMLIYLNGFRNTYTAPDENYARELMELFILGKGPDSQYTESDVREAARVLTGWRVRSADLIGFFQGNQHDTGDKVFSSFFNNRVITGRTGPTGALETRELIDMIFEKRETAKYLCRKLYRHFIYYTIDAQAESEVIDPLADIFIQSNFEIKPVLKALLSSAHFHDEENRGCFIKTPLNTCSGLARTFGLTFPDPGQYLRANYLLNFDFYLNASAQQLAFLSPPNVAGWPAFYQEPQFYQLWINATSLPQRDAFSSLMMNRGLIRLRENVKINTIEFCAQFDNVYDPNELIKKLIAVLLGLDVSESRFNYMKNILLSGQAEDYYWTDAWINYISFPNENNTAIVRTRLDALLGYLISIPEYHLC